MLVVFQPTKEKEP